MGSYINKDRYDKTQMIENVKTLQLFLKKIFPVSNNSFNFALILVFEATTIHF